MELYICVSITHYGKNVIRCTLAQAVDNGKLEVTQLEENHAHKLLWELVLAGGRRTYRTNIFDNTIVSQQAVLYIY